MTKNPVQDRLDFSALMLDTVYSTKKTIMKVKELYEGYLAHRAKEGNTPKTIYEHRRFLYGPIDQATGHREIDDRLNMLVRADLIEAGQGHGLYGPQRSVVYFRQLMQYAVLIGLRPGFDWRDMKIPYTPNKRVNYLSPEEMTKIRDCFRPDGIRDIPKFRTRALIEFMLGTGLRIGEACSVDIKHINTETKELWFINIKTGEEETMTLNDHVMEWLELYLKSRKDDCPALFVSGRGRLLPSTSRNYIHLKTQHLGLNKRIAHHIFRRTCCTYLLQDKVEIQVVQNYLRHKSERTTLRYYAGVKKESSKDIAQKVMGKFIVRPAMSL